MADPDPTARLAEVETELERLREVERRLVAVAEHAPDYIIELDRAGVITYMNRPAPGHSLDEMIGTNVRAWMEPSAHADFGRTVARVFETAELCSYRSTGSVTGRSYVNRVSPVVVDGHVRSAILITHDVTELAAAQARAAEAETRLRALVDGSFQGFTIAVDGVIIEANAAFAEMFGLTVAEVIGRTPADLATPESAARVLEHIRAGCEKPYEVVALRPDGSTFPVEIVARNCVYDGSPARITGFRDLTEQRQREAEQQRREDRVRHAQKLETLGVLAGGVAHDFNNLLTVVLATSDLMIAAPADLQTTRRRLGQVREAAVRAAELTRQLLVYAGRGSRGSEPVDLNALVRDTAALLRVSVSKKAQLDLSLAPNLPSVEADAGQLRQVLMNLIVNASEALAGRPGSIDVRTGVVEVTRAGLERGEHDAGLEPGRYVTAVVADDGVGMDDRTAERIFEPFFTTKFAGRGLGLASVQGIVRAHGGAIEVDTGLARGTRIAVLLPEGPGAAAVASPPEHPLHHTPPGLLLVAEDEPAIAALVRAVMEDRGHCVIVARDGDEALAAFRGHTRELTLAVIDLTMPRVGGLEVVRQIREVRPDLPVVLMSGYSAEALTDRLRTGPRTAFLPKPFRVRDLLAAVDGLH